MRGDRRHVVRNRERKMNGIQDYGGESTITTAKKEGVSSF